MKAVPSTDQGRPRRPLALGRAARASLLVLALMGSLVVAPAALADPPPNDNRASAQVLPTFPADIHGTLVEATVERLDPQVSDCGSVASTVWYRINVAPDGIVTMSVRGAAGVAPVIRAYRINPSSISEVDCGAAVAGGTATASFETVRGANYFLLVGRRPTSADGEFDLHVELTLPPDPPANDRAGAARRIASLPAAVTGTTVGARSDESDPGSCGLARGTVWYRLVPRRDGLVVLRLQMARNVDGVAVVLRRVGTRLRPVTCRQTGGSGRATVPFAATRGVTYYVVVGQPEDSDAGTFTLRGVAAAPAERFPGRALPARGARATLNGLTNVNDIWRFYMARGTSYRISYASSGCARLRLRLANRAAPLLELGCRGYRVFTPGPGGGGRYAFEVRAAAAETSQPYRLQVQRVEADDIGVGLLLGNHRTRTGTLAPQGVDVVDVYHFDVERRSDVSLSVAFAAGLSFRLSLVTEAGGRIGSGDAIRRRLPPGRYVAAVSAPPGTAGGSYRIGLLVRDITTTTLSVGTTRVAPESPILLRPQVTPATAGTVEIQIDRFDPFGGWQFYRTARLPVGGSLSWTPPSEGIWRARATFLGSATASPSRSGYARVVVR